MKINELATVSAPFSQPQVNELLAYQQNGTTAPLRCPDHNRVLIVSATGLACDACSYLLKSCPEYIVNGRWRQFFKQVTKP